MVQDFNESEIVKQITKHDRAAFNLLYTQYLDQLYRYIYLMSKSKEVSEEIVQDVFIKIWEHRENLESVSSFKSYTFRCAKNLLLDHIRKEKLQARTLTLITTEIFAEDADAKFQYKQYYQIVQNAIKLLPTKRKRIIELRTHEELSLDEIASKLSISKSVVKKQLYKGLSFVRKYLHQHGNIAVILLIAQLMLPI